MRLFQFLTLGGAMALNFEDLSYSKLKGAFSKVKLTAEWAKLRHMSSRDPPSARSGDRTVRLGPRFPKFCWSRSEPVLDVPKFSGPGGSWISQNFSSWSGPILNSPKFFGPGPVWSWDGSGPWIPDAYVNLPGTLGGPKSLQ